MPATRKETERALGVASIAVVALYGLIQHLGLEQQQMVLDGKTTTAERLYARTMEIVRPVNQANDGLR